ncbi:MAG: hypothetical protein J0653_08400, partial [Deltaproteobacteria bacterium]|nr:hypothetical protein [Deltaproteobacteria bacterium]
ITWTPYIKYTSYPSWNEKASVAINGSSAWTSPGDSIAGGSSTSISISIPANKTSTIVFQASAGRTTVSTGSLNLRATLLAFYNNSLVLPAGLEYVDDLGTITGASMYTTP